MIDAMKKLWTITSDYPASQSPPADLERRRKFVTDLTEWYYKEGNGLFLSIDSRNALFRVRCCALRPDEAKAIGLDLNHQRFGPGISPEKDDELTPALRQQASELRSQLKSSLGSMLSGAISPVRNGKERQRPLSRRAIDD